MASLRKTLYPKVGEMEASRVAEVAENPAIAPKEAEVAGNPAIATRPSAADNHAAADWSLETGKAYADWLGGLDLLSVQVFDEVQVQIDYWHAAMSAGGGWAFFALELRNYWSLVGDAQDRADAAAALILIGNYGRWAAAMFPVDPVTPIMTWLSQGN